MPDSQTDARAEDRKQSDDDPEKKDREAAKPTPRWPFVLAGVVVLGFIAIVLYDIFAPTPDVWTDDAYVRVHYAKISPRVSGHVTTVLVNDNEAVRSGQALVTLDPRDYQAAVDEAEGVLASAQAQVSNSGANVKRQPALIREEEATVASARAQLQFAQSNAGRYRGLAPSGAVTATNLQQANTSLAEAQAALNRAQAALDAAQLQMQVLGAMQTAAQAAVKSDQARLYQARLNLSYTRILAPIDGVVGERSVQIGDDISPTSIIMTVVPLRDAYIIANYREVALRHVRPGQAVTIHVDAFDIDLRGVVNSIAPATGATFSPIPPMNATGNFTKITQRLPVKITLAPGQRQSVLLRDGFSVETTIHTHLANVRGDV